jgi:hypothetical protein
MPDWFETFERRNLEENERVRKGSAIDEVEGDQEGVRCFRSVEKSPVVASCLTQVKPVERFYLGGREQGSVPAQPLAPCASSALAATRSPGPSIALGNARSSS